MMSRYIVYLDSASIESIDPRIIVRDIAHRAPDEQVSTALLAGRAGLHEQKRIRQSVSVEVSIEIHEPNIAQRQEICMRVQRFVKKGRYLSTNDKPGQRLRVKCDVPPVIDSAKKWTDTLRIVFTAYEFPYWEDERAATAAVSAAGGTAALYAKGTADRCPVEAVVKNTGTAEINNVTIVAGDTSMEFKNLGLAPRQELLIGYDERGFMVIRADGVSKLNKRTAESSDELLIPCGASANVSLTADGAATAVFTARGRYE